MDDTRNDDTVYLAGSGECNHVNCETFRVDGTATVNDGVVADVVTVDGSLDVGGPVEGAELDVDGTAGIGGDVRAEHATVDGSVAFGGDVSVDHLEVDGSTSIDGNLDCHEVAGDGSTSVDGNLVAHEASFDGSVTVDGLADVTGLRVEGAGTFRDVTAETFEAEGALRANEVSARTFDLTLGDVSTAEAIDGGHVVVRPGGNTHSPGCGPLNRDDPILEVGTVTGKTVDLDATRAETVVGESVTLGPDVEVDVVYTDDLDADDGPTVGDVRPFGDY